MIRLVTIVLALGLAACATLTPSEAPGCSGPRRPANPYGSVLASDAAAPATSPSTDSGQCLGGRR